MFDPYPPVHFVNSPRYEHSQRALLTIDQCQAAHSGHLVIDAISAIAADFPLTCKQVYVQRVRIGSAKDRGTVYSDKNRNRAVRDFSL
jgi:hypothetical protein